MKPQTNTDRHRPRARPNPQRNRPIRSGGTVVCRCEEVTEGEIRTTIRRGYRDLEEIKRILRCGMGHCQGRSCMMIIARILSQETGIPIPGMNFPGSRPPLKPVPLATLGR
jgi:bacterioferritin-associated ferredoxin